MQDTPDPLNNTRRLFAEAHGLSNDQLSSRVAQLNRQRQFDDAKLLYFLSEFDARKLYRELACSSLFDYLTSRLGQSEDVAYRWMWGARLVRAFPLVFELLANGRLHLSGLMVLKPHLTQENHREWLLAAADKSKREIERMVVARVPRADVPPQVRQLPHLESCRMVGARESVSAMNLETNVAQPQTAATAATTATTTAATTATTTAVATAESREPGTAVVQRASVRGPDSPTVDPVSRLPRIQPLSEHSYRVVFTAGERLKQKLQRAGELLSHAVHPSDLPSLIERAVDLLIEREERRRYGSARRGRASLPAAASAILLTSEPGSVPTPDKTPAPPPAQVSAAALSSASRPSSAPTSTSGLCSAVPDSSLAAAPSLDTHTTDGIPSGLTKQANHPEPHYTRATCRLKFADKSGSVTRDNAPMWIVKVDGAKADTFSSSTIVALTR